MIPVLPEQYRGFRMTFPPMPERLTNWSAELPIVSVDELLELLEPAA